MPGIGKEAVYAGAKVVADSLHSEIAELKSVTKEEREGLLEGLGIAKIENRNGEISTSVSWSGYNSFVTKKYPKGHPNIMIARSVNRGTSWRNADPFVRRAVRKCKEKANKAMEEVINKRLVRIAGK